MYTFLSGFSVKYSMVGCGW